MPRKSKVVEQQSEAPLPETQVIEQTIDETTIETTLPPDAPAPAAEAESLPTLPPDEVKEVKVKAKRKAQPKKIKVKEIEEVKLEETPINIPEEPKESTEEATKEKKVKTLEQVKCDTCEKEMTKRTLRYHHKCPGEVIKREEIPVKKRVKKETKQDTPKEEIKAPEKPTLTNTYHERLQRALEKRHENIQKLASQIV
jgi:hypothetical protein